MNYLVIIALSQKHLWGYVKKVSVDDGICNWAFAQNSGLSQIGDEVLIVMDQNVSRFQVPMYDIGLMKCFDARNYLKKLLFSRFFSNELIISKSSHFLFQSAVITKLNDQINFTFLLKGFVQF